MRRDIFHADARQFGGQQFGGAAAIALVLGQRGDGWNAQQVLQFVEKTRVILGANATAGEDMTCSLSTISTGESICPQGALPQRWWIGRNSITAHGGVNFD